MLRQVVRCGRRLRSSNAAQTVTGRVVHVQRQDDANDALVTIEVPPTEKPVPLAGAVDVFERLFDPENADEEDQEPIVQMEAHTVIESSVFGVPESNNTVFFKCLPLSGACSLLQPGQTVRVRTKVRDFSPNEKSNKSEDIFAAIRSVFRPGEKQQEEQKENEENAPTSPRNKMNSKIPMIVSSSSKNLPDMRLLDTGVPAIDLLAPITSQSHVRVFAPTDMSPIQTSVLRSHHRDHGDLADSLESLRAIIRRFKSNWNESTHVTTVSAFADDSEFTSLLESETAEEVPLLAQFRALSKAHAKSQVSRDALAVLTTLDFVNMRNRLLLRLGQLPLELHELLPNIDAVIKYGQMAPMISKRHIQERRATLDEHTHARVPDVSSLLGLRARHAPLFLCDTVPRELLAHDAPLLPQMPHHDAVFALSPFAQAPSFDTHLTRSRNSHLITDEGRGEVMRKARQLLTRGRALRLVQEISVHLGMNDFALDQREMMLLLRASALEGWLARHDPFRSSANVDVEETLETAHRIITDMPQQELDDLAACRPVYDALPGLVSGRVTHESLGELKRQALPYPGDWWSDMLHADAIDSLESDELAIEEHTLRRRDDDDDDDWNWDWQLEDEAEDEAEGFAFADSSENANLQGQNDAVAVDDTCSTNDAARESSADGEPAAATVGASEMQPI
ncbi:MAG: hypothetical protein MHM6MM_002357 [Cercozoa sp. M6MM]